MSTPPIPQPSPAERALEDELASWEAAHPLVEDGSAPEPVMIERVQRVRGWQHVACARCGAVLTPVFAERVENGVWESLQAEGALSLEVSGGYGMYVDPPSWGHDHGDATVLTCESCTSWLRSELPGLDLVLRRLERR